MKHIYPIAVFFTVVLMLTSSAVVAADDVPRMTKEELKAMLNNPDLVIIDVRTGRDWASSESKIKGAVREEPNKAESWADKYEKSKTLVLYCA